MHLTGPWKDTTPLSVMPEGEDHMNRYREDAMRDFYDSDFRHEYTDQFLQIRIASQIKALREQRGWTQQSLAERAEMKQSRVSAMENVNYSSWNVRTLRRLARAFDVALNVEFKSFGARLVEDMEPFSRRSLEVVPFEEDPIFKVPPVETMPRQVMGAAIMNSALSSQWSNESSTTQVLPAPPVPVREPKDAKKELAAA